MASTSSDGTCVFSAGAADPSAICTALISGNVRTRLIGRWTRSKKNKLKVEPLADQPYRKSHSQTNSLGKLEPQSSSQPRFVAVSWGSSLGTKIWSSLWSGPTGLCWTRLVHFARIVRLLSPAFDFTRYLVIEACWRSSYILVAVLAWASGKVYGLGNNCSPVCLEEEQPILDIFTATHTSVIFIHQTISALSSVKGVMWGHSNIR